MSVSSIWGDSSLVLDHYLEAFSRKPGAFPRSAPLEQAKKSGTFSVDHAEFLASASALYGENRGVGEMVGVLLLARRLPQTANTTGLRKAQEMRTFIADYVKIAARSSLVRGATLLKEVPIITSPEVDITRYDVLFEARS